MRRFIYIIGTLALVVILAAGIGLGTFFYKAHALDAESKAFVDNAVPAIAASWSKQQFLDRAAPEVSERVKPGDLNALFEHFSQLGPLAEYQGATGEATMSYLSGTGGTVSAFYVANAHCQNGGVTFRIGLVKRDGRWMIRDFRVDPMPGNRSEQGA